MMRWWGPGNDGPRTAQTDVRVGGSFRVSFKSNDGEHNEVGGVYREVVQNRKLVFTWAWHTTPERESLVTIDLKPDGDGTILTLMHEQFFDEKARDDHRIGWTRFLDRMEMLLT